MLFVLKFAVPKLCSVRPVSLTVPPGRVRPPWRLRFPDPEMLVTEAPVFDQVVRPVTVMLSVPVSVVVPAEAPVTRSDDMVTAEPVLRVTVQLPLLPTVTAPIEVMTTPL